jgi:hypothetical protein
MSNAILEKDFDQKTPLIPFIVFGPYGILFSKVLCDLLKDCH